MAGRGYTVLHVAQPVGGGVARFVLDAARDQRQRGWQVLVACPGKGWLAAELRAAGVTWIPWAASRSPGWRTPAETVRLRNLVRRIEPDVLHLHSAKAGLAGRLAVHGGVRTLYQPHGWSWLAARGAMARIAVTWERFAMRWTDLVICVGEDEAELARQRRLDGSLVVVRNGVDLNRFGPADWRVRDGCRERLGINPGTPLAVCVGRVTRQKGQDRLVAAWRIVHDKCPDAELIVVGDGDLRRTLSQAAPAGVRFVPHVIDPRPWFAAADVVVLPSRWEGLSLTLLEALAVGRSVVVTDIPGLREPLRGMAAARVPIDDLPAMAAAIATRLSDDDLRRSEEVAARQRVLEFDLCRTLNQLAAVTLGTGPVGLR